MIKLGIPLVLVGLVLVYAGDELLAIWPVLSPEPAPIHAPGLRVLIVEESSEREKLPREQLELLASRDVRKWLDEHCAMGSDGKTPEWRIFDPDANLAKESTIWREAIKIHGEILPRIVVSNGKRGFVGPLPANTAEALKLLAKYAEN